MLTKDLLRVSRAGGGFAPKFVGREVRPLAARLIGVYRDHVGEPRATLDEAVTSLERESDAHFKLVRGFAALLDREADFEVRAAVPPDRARRAAFEEAAALGVVTKSGRERALAAAADRLHVSTDALETALYADREPNEVLASFDPRWDPDGLLEQYNLSLAQTALFDAVEVRVRSADPKRLVNAVKRLGLLYEIHETGDGREVVVTGPDALFGRSRRYGTNFARLLRVVATAPEWELTATIDDRGTERELTLATGDVTVPDVDPVTEPAFDSDVEADFAARFRSLDLDWDLVREPEPLAVGTRVMIPDFAFDYRPPGAGETGPADEFRVFFEIMGFWTPDYVAKKLAQLDGVEDVELLVAVDESLGVGEEIEARDHRAIPYRGTVRVKDVVDVLREYERDLVADAATALPDELRPAADVTTLSEVAADHGVSEAALEDTAFPDHRRVGRTLLRESVIEELRSRIEPGQTLSEAESVLEEYGVDDASALLSTLGYRVEWEGLSGGTISER